ncbi:MAG: ABC transporter ATP-binding protein, partial [Lachnospiraceae bacterium]
YKRFDDLVKEKTAVYISHRMSSCRFCNNIFVFDEGRIVQKGSHEALMKEEGLYRKLWNAQAQYYR